MDELARCIIRAFDFDGDHLYGFQFAGRDGRRMRAEHPYVQDAELRTDELAIGELPLNERQSMQFQYDYGADWRFEVRLEKIDPDAQRPSKPKVIESHGEPPAEYPEDDDDW
jgi:hypothetical protein